MQQEHFLVVGLGITGFSVINYLIKHKPTASITVTDSRSMPPKLLEVKNNWPQVKLLLGKFTVPDNISTVVVSPGVALNELVIPRDVPIIGDIELFARAGDKPVIAVTGSNGKSTVTTLLGLMAKASGLKVGVGGNLGTPALELLNNNADIYILELSSFQLETVSSLRPIAVTVLNISPDHMDRYADVADYQQAKLRIYNHAQLAIVNRADILTWVPDHIPVNSISFGLDQPTGENYGLVSDDDGALWLSKGQRPLLLVAELAMLGAHNIENALAALALGEAAGFDLNAMLQVLTEFTGLEHRCEKIIAVNNIVWVNDSKGTNVAATVAAIHGLAKSITGKWIIILGGVGKNADFTPLLEPLKKCCRAAILIGTEQQQLWDLLHQEIKCFKANDLTEVVKLAAEHAVPGDGVLLSPACASFDMFNDYTHRGAMFKQTVLQQIGKHHATATD